MYRLVAETIAAVLTGSLITVLAIALVQTLV